MHKSLRQAIQKFRTALINYQTAEGEEREHWKTVMDTQLPLIQATVQEIKTTGIGKQGKKVEADYRRYMQDNSDASFAALEHNIETLQDFNQIS